MTDTDATDVAAKHPEKLAELKALWWSEAKKYANPPVYELPEAMLKLIRQNFDPDFPRDGEYVDAFKIESGKPR